jgi:hypothetical protein
MVADVHQMVVDQVEEAAQMEVLAQAVDLDAHLENNAHDSFI